jgi:hypothetical protein
MMPELKWIFDALPASGAKRGGNPEDYALGDLSLDTMVREVLQNCHDQKLESDSPVTVEFKLCDLKGEERQKLLDAVAWEVLEGHLAGMAAHKNPVGETFARELQEIHDREFLRVLYIRDSGTKGLIGGEDEGELNFGALCRHVLQTSEDDQERGGSYGLGKAVLWAFSGVQTVILTSRLSEPDKHGARRLFGRSNLSYHQAHGEDWEGLGFFGLEDPTGRNRAVSAWEDDAALCAADLGMPFDWSGEESGTGILLFDFDEPEINDDRPLIEIAGEIRDAASRWFWPCLRNETLVVRTEAFDGEEKVFDEESTTDLDEIRPFAQICMPGGTIKSRLEEEGDLGQRSIDVKVPERYPAGGDEGDPGGESPALVRLGLLSSDSPWAGSVALIRGAGMVVDYWKPRAAADSDLNLYGVFLGGTIAAFGGPVEPKHRRLERFLRAAEPPAHNRWVHTTRRIQRRYARGSKRALDSLWQEINSVISELGGAAPPPGEQGPEGLAKLLDPGSGVNPPRVPKIELEHAKAHLDESKLEWVVEGSITRSSGDKPWRARLCLVLATDGGSTTRQRLDLGNYEVLTAGVECRVVDRYLEISVPAGVSSAQIKVWSAPLDRIELESGNPVGHRGNLGVVAKVARLVVDVSTAPVGASSGV